VSGCAADLPVAAARGSLVPLPKEGSSDENASSALFLPDEAALVAGATAVDAGRTAAPEPGFPGTALLVCGIERSSESKVYVDDEERDEGAALQSKPARSSMTSVNVAVGTTWRKEHCSTKRSRPCGAALMFRAPNPFEEPVAKATDENLTGENWALNLGICDKLSDNNDSDARQCIAAVQKRLQHRNANVQLYALTLTDMLSKNCGDAVHHEIASRAFTQALARVVMDRATHLLVKKRALKLMREWAQDYEQDDTLSLVAETVHNLKEEYFELEDDEPAKPDVVRRRVALLT